MDLQNAKIGQLLIPIETFDAGVAFSAMHTTARMPWIFAASATPCAWLPADEHTTPRFF